MTDDEKAMFDALAAGLKPDVHHASADEILESGFGPILNDGVSASRAMLTAAWNQYHLDDGDPEQVAAAEGWAMMMNQILEAGPGEAGIVLSMTASLLTKAVDDSATMLIGGMIGNPDTSKWSEEQMKIRSMAATQIFGELMNLLDNFSLDQVRDANLFGFTLSDEEPES